GKEIPHGHAGQRRLVRRRPAGRRWRPVSAPGLDVSRPRDARRRLRLQGRSRALPAGHRALMPLGAPHRVDAQIEASRKCAPAPLRRDIDEVNAFVYDNINNGVYRCGLAKSQAAYAAAFHKLFAALDELEHRLGRQRWLVGGRFTEADLRLFPTLVRFDTVYYVLFKCNLRRLADYHHLSNYLREIYQMPGVAETVDFELIKLGYYGGMKHINPNGILPFGPKLDLSAPHDRARLPASA